MRTLLFLFLIGIFALATPLFGADAAVPAAPIWVVIAGGVFVVLEWLLGETQLIKANSTIALIFGVIKKIAKAISGK